MRTASGYPRQAALAAAAQELQGTDPLHSKCWTLSENLGISLEYQHLKKTPHLFYNRGVYYSINAYLGHRKDSRFCSSHGLASHLPRLFRISGTARTHHWLHHTSEERPNFHFPERASTLEQMVLRSPTGLF